MRKSAKSTRYFHYSTLFVFCQALALLVGASTSVLSAHADEEIHLSDDQRGAISVGCASIKSSLASLQKSDSATRVHLGTTYQTILSNYLTPLNVRLVKNNQLGNNLNALYNDFSAKRNEFNQQFITYSRKLESLMSIDCKSEPDKFYAELVKTREERAKVSKLAGDVRNILSKHFAAVQELKK